MSKTLDEILDVFMKSKEDIINKNATAKDRDELITTLREKIKANIIQEIRIEYKDEIVAQANGEIQKRINKEKIRQLKSLMWNGFFVAFLVGLAVNQITDLIAVFKENHSNIVTLIISVVLLGIVVLMYFYQFIKEAIKTWDIIEKSNQEGEE
jgi:DNA polymerase III delta prime subunit